MTFHYRVRALVDSSAEEVFVSASCVHEAMLEFSKTSTGSFAGEVFGDFGIDVAMVHKVTFAEDGPVFEDVTHQLSNKWARTNFDQCMLYYKREETPA